MEFKHSVKMQKLIAPFAAFAALTLTLAAVPSPAFAQRLGQDQSRAPSAPRSPGGRGEQASARQEMQAGRNMSIREIKRRVEPRVDADEYLGFEYDSGASAYRLKFIKNGKVIFVDVDAKTARILRIRR